MARPDPFLNMLKDVGYLPVRLPRAGVSPLQVVLKEGKELAPLGDLGDAMVPATAVLPQVTVDLQTANIVEGARTSKIKLGVGLSLLGSLLKAFSGKNLDLSASFQGAKTVQFQFAGVQVDKIDVLKLDEYLNETDIDPRQLHVARLLMDDKIAVITSIVKATKIMVTAQDDSGSDIDLNVPAISGAVSGTVGLNVNATGNTKVTYEGSNPVAFGIQAVRVFFDDAGNYTAFKPISAGDGALRSLGNRAASSPEPISIEGTFLDIVEPSTDMLITKRTSTGA
ncbi:MAG TPA: hypothetical protein VE621_18215 [Bryobacteraceae bacterium]|nr:hypothetical protein [Bryobacteraceae bacterium]